MGEKIVVTGSSGDLGSALAKKFKNEQFEIIGIDIKEGEFTTDVLDLKNLSNLKEYEFNFEKQELKAFVHCAAIQDNMKEDLLIEDFYNVNLISSVILIEKLYQHFSLDSSICFISSVHSSQTNGKFPYYSSSKAAFGGLVSSYTNSLSPNTSAFQIILGAMDSQMLHANLSEEQINFLKSNLPAKKLINHQELSNFIYDAITKYNNLFFGSSIEIDNGVTKALNFE